MEKIEEVCKNCAFAAVRTDVKRFQWCKYLCTLQDTESRHIAYRYEDSTCEHFTPTQRAYLQKGENV